MSEHEEAKKAIEATYWIYRIVEVGDARKQGLTTYFTGRPCKHGHIDLRLVSSFTCRTCSYANVRVCGKRVPEEVRKQRYERSKTYNKKPKTPEQRKIDVIKAKQWAEKNPGRALLNKSLYKKQVKLATPKWLSEEHKEQMYTIYEVCQTVKRQLSVPHEVDHIVPLRGKIVCGLNVPWNLQILPKRINNTKSNRFEGIG
jgi:5-methylcytosine-specific restriction endonuclease McrA